MIFQVILRITKKNAEVIKIILDNNEEIVCTPNHKFMLREGTYKQAQNLTKQDSLMPLNKKLSNYCLIRNELLKFIIDH